MKRIGWYIRVCSLIMILSTVVSINEECQAQAQVKENVANDPKREELQRYFGYENLLYRYMTLPYDVSINTNQPGNFLEIGFLYLLILPLLLMATSLNRKRFWIYMIIAMILFIISTSNSWLFSHKINKIDSNPALIDNYLSNVKFGEEPLDIITGHIYSISHSLYKPFGSIAEALSGDQDHVTFPLILLMLLAGIFFVMKSESKSEMRRLFIAFTVFYGFYWFSFAGGVIWYGYILLFVFYLFILTLLSRLGKDSVIGKFFHYSFLIGAIVCMTLGIVNRFSNINPNTPETNLGKGIFNPLFLDYACDRKTEEDILQLIYYQSAKTFAQINIDKRSNILRIGTSMTYFIDNNHKRVQIDNQLGTFYALRKRYPDNSVLVDALKASNINYIIYDLNTATIDYTPEKSLTRKANLFMDFVKNNPRVKLLSSDRIVQEIVNNKPEYRVALEGQTYYNQGSYAIFQLI